MKQILSNSKFKLIEDHSDLTSLMEHRFYPHYLILDNEYLNEHIMAEIKVISHLGNCFAAIVAKNRSELPLDLIPFFLKTDFISLPLQTHDVFSVLKKFAIHDNSISVDLKDKKIRIDISFPATLTRVSETQIEFTSPIKYNKDSIVNLQGSFFTEQNVDGHQVNVIRESEYNLEFGSFVTRSYLKSKNENVLKKIRTI